MSSLLTCGNTEKPGQWASFIKLVMDRIRNEDLISSLTSTLLDTFEITWNANCVPDLLWVLGLNLVAN